MVKCLRTNSTPRRCITLSLAFPPRGRSLSPPLSLYPASTKIRLYTFPPRSKHLHTRNSSPQTDQRKPNTKRNTFTHLPKSNDPRPRTLSPALPTMSTPSTHLSTLQTQGYVKIPSLLPSHLLLALQAAAKYTTDRARNGKWPYIRTVPKQYPPWPEYRPEIPHKRQTSPRQQHDDAEVPNIWGIQHLLHPDMPVRDTFAEVYFCDEVLDVVRELLAPSATTPAHSEGERAQTQTMTETWSWNSSTCSSPPRVTSPSL